MNFLSRKLKIWLISLGCLILIYLLYTTFNQTPPIVIEQGSVTEAVEDLEGKVGKIGDIGIGTVELAEFVTLNKNKEVDRIWGFKKLLHKERDEWEIENPYMTIFRPDFKCTITADKGKIQVETVIGKPTPKDATLIGNVVINILPENGHGVKATSIYLDNIVFVSEKSLFSTSGPVKLISEDAQIIGTGLEIIYNDQDNRFELFRIVDLTTLKLKTSAKTSLFASKEKNDSSSQFADAQSQSQLPAEPVSPEDTQDANDRTKGEYYKCLLSDNVVINCPDQLIVADEIYINKIFFSENSTKESEKKEVSNEDSTGTAEVNAESSAEPNEPVDDLFDTFITCDGGIAITPMDSSILPITSVKQDTETMSVDTKKLQALADAAGRTKFFAQKIDYDLSTEDIVGSGASEITFYIKDFMGAENKEVAVPVTITARKNATFLPASNKVIFEGDTVCKMVRDSLGIQQKYTLSAPRLTVDLSTAKDNPSSTNGVKHLIADGDTVRLASVKNAGDKFLGGIELKCSRFQYDAEQKLFLATASAGVIKVDNSSISDSDAKGGRFSLQKPCWALIQDFDKLEYSLESNRIIADSGLDKISIGYIPIIQGQYGQPVKATAGHIEANLMETPEGQSTLSILNATEGITYNDEDVQFIGDEFSYDANASKITARGNKSKTCLFNDTLVDGIEYNLETGKVKIDKIKGGVFRFKK